MIKMIMEQDGSPFGLTQWWELSKMYESIITVKEPKCTLRISDGLSSKFVEPRHRDPVRILYPLLISKYNLNELDYELQQTVYGTGIIDFPIEKKMEILEMIDNVIAENSIF